MSALGFVDGNTEEGVLFEAPGLYPRLEFSWRTMTSQEFAAHLTATEKLSEEQANNLIAAHLAGKVKKWDLKGRKDDVQPISAAGMKSLKRALFSRLWRIVAGLEGPDEVRRDPADAELEMQAQLQAAEQGRPVNEVREELRRGNLPGQSPSL